MATRRGKCSNARRGQGVEGSGGPNERGDMGGDSGRPCRVSAAAALASFDWNDDVIVEVRVCFNCSV